MKHLKTFEELDTKTYISAADQLRKNHPERAQRLDDHADEMDKLKSKSDDDKFETYSRSVNGNYKLELIEIEDGSVTFVDQRGAELKFLVTGEKSNKMKYGGRYDDLTFTTRKDAIKFLDKVKSHKGFENLRVNDLYVSR